MSVCHIKYIAKHKDILKTRFQDIYVCLRGEPLRCVCIFFFVCVCMKRERFVSMSHKGLQIPCTTVSKQKTQGCWQCSSFLKAGNTEPKEEQESQFNLKALKTWCPSSSIQARELSCLPSVFCPSQLFKGASGLDKTHSGEGNMFYWI